MGKIKAIICCVLISLLHSCFSRNCDDCMHYALKISIRDNTTGSAVTKVLKVILEHGSTIDTLYKSDFVGTMTDSMYHIPGTSGLYNITIIQEGYETIQLNAVLVKENDCNVITKIFTIGCDKIDTLTKKQPIIIDITESENCG
jgi:hypothetical protein